MCNDTLEREFIEIVTPPILREWNLVMNEAKTERTTLVRKDDQKDEQWRTVRKLGSLLGESDDISRRKQLAIVAFRNLMNLWVRRNQISEKLRLRLYNAFVLPVLTYNMGTWGLTKREEEKIEAFHRKQLRMLLGIHHPNHITNANLYERCGCHRLGLDIVNARWRLFGHILRLPDDVPAYLAMTHYFLQTDCESFRGRCRSNLPSKLNDDLKNLSKHDSRVNANVAVFDHSYATLNHSNSSSLKLNCMGDLIKLKRFASDRDKWIVLIELLVEAAQVISV